MDAGMSTARFKALGYTKDNIHQEYIRRTILTSNKDLIKSYINLKVGKIYSNEVIKEMLVKFYNDLGIEKKEKATDITEWYDIKLSPIQKDGKTVSAYKIIGVK